MPKRMLIDASHPEETRVVVLDGQKVEEFDFEAASKRPLKGNIYLAKVTRVEPSLQAAFVEYGGNRQGFLAFSEIHPDYYQIPVADRQALLAEQEAEARRRSDDDVESFDIAPGPKPEAQTEFDENETVEIGEPDDAAGEELNHREIVAETSEEHFEDTHHESRSETSFENLPIIEDHDEGAEFADTPHDEAEEQHEHVENLAETFSSESTPVDLIESDGAEQPVHDIQTDGDASEGQPAQPLQSQKPAQRWVRKRHYKIQEVIKRRQIILVQVVKEERGNKGAALTTYLSLAGRYCVLMPNTPRGGGISRKITNANDRKRLKSAAQALELPEGMGLIIRTAGENRTKVEIKRDYEYLLRMWDTIRETTLQSNAPAKVYEEGDLIKRAIRDLYNKDVGEIIVEGDDGYRNAKDFMRMLMPSHAKNVKPYKEPAPLFQRHHIEAQLDAMFSPTVTLKSGGYIVINQTEALVSIDVNSGRATREHSIEETARKTNLEAADEVGRQLRLRDLAGLIVIDFIDMEDSRNDRDVEKRIRDAVKNDRARVQIGKISQFGLLEMSRQRLRAGVIAGSTVACPHCGGQGIVRSVESTALRLLRALEEEGQKLKASAVSVRIASDVAIYTLNQKRRELSRIETDYGMTITFDPKDGLMAGTFEIERTVQMTPEEREKYAASIQAEFVPPVDEEEPEDIVELEDEEESELEEAATTPEQQSQQQPTGSSSKRRRRRRGGRGRSSRTPSQQQPGELQSSPDSQDHETVEQPAKHTADTAPITSDSAPATDESAAPQPDGAQTGVPGQPGAPRKRRRRRGKRGGSSHSSNAQETQPSTLPNNGHDRFGVPDEIDTTPKLPDADTSKSISTATPNASSTPVWSLSAEGATQQAEAALPGNESLKEEQLLETADSAPSTTAQPAKKGWWQRTFRPSE
jgi:ribonuclease E